jgi:cytochrome c oxidase assembly protein subunit 15
VAIALSLIQVVLGTQVRQEVDMTIKSVGYNKSLWMQDPTLTFYIHRTFSIIIFLVNLFLFIKNRKGQFGYKKVNLIMLFIVLEIATGIAMFYFDFPFLSQPLHLVIATILFGIQFYVYLESKRDIAPVAI